MAQLTKNTPRQFEGGELQALPVAASAVIYQGAFVGLNGSSCRQVASGDAFVGVAEEIADNSAGSAGDINVRLWRDRYVKMDVTGASSASVGAKVYAIDSDTLTLTVGSNVHVGFVDRHITGTTCIVHASVAAVRASV